MRDRVLSEARRPQPRCIVHQFATRLGRALPRGEVHDHEMVRLYPGEGGLVVTSDDPTTATKTGHVIGASS